MTTSNAIFNVSIMTTATDNGYCMSFTSEAEAIEAANAARADGCFHVVLWSTPENARISRWPR